MSAYNTYRTFAQYYDTYVQHFEEDLALYASLCKPEGRILEVGCGTGRVLQYLLSQGFCLSGIDISEEMLDIAREKLREFQQKGDVHLQCHNFMDAPLPEKYDTVLVTFYTFNYILHEPEIFLKHLRASMGQDAMLVMDLFVPKTFTRPELENVWTSREFEYHGTQVTLQDKRTFSDHLEERTQVYTLYEKPTQITTCRRYYSPDATRALLKTAGFTQILFSENYDSNDFKPEMNIDNINTHFVVKATN